MCYAAPVASGLWKSLPTIFIYPLLLLLVTSALRTRLDEPRMLWQPPILEPWIENARIPQRISTGRSLLGWPIYDPDTMAGRAQLWRKIAAATLLFSILLAIAAHRFCTMPFRPIRFSDVAICAAAPWLPRIALILFPLFAAELLAVVYFSEILFDGAVMYATPAIALVIAAGSVSWVFGFPGTAEMETPPTRVNGILLRPELQPEVYALPGVKGLRIAATLAPAVTLLAGRTQCQDEVVNGRLLLVSLTLCRILTREELVCLVALACEPMSWPGIGWQYEAGMQSIHRLQRRIVETIQGGMLARIVPGALPAMGLCGYMSQLHDGSSASQMHPTPDGDRTTAAKFGSLDLARSLLKTYVCQHLWPKFELKMKHALTSGGKGPRDYESIALQSTQMIDGDAILSAYHEIESVRHPLALYDRLARLGYDGPDAWPKLDFSPEEPAFGVLRDALTLEGELSAAERARFVLG